MSTSERAESIRILFRDFFGTSDVIGPVVGGKKDVARVYLEPFTICRVDCGEQFDEIKNGVAFHLQQESLINGKDLAPYIRAALSLRRINDASETPGCALQALKTAIALMRSDRASFEAMGLNMNWLEKVNA